MPGEHAPAIALDYRTLIIYVHFGPNKNPRRAGQISGSVIGVATWHRTHPGSILQDYSAVAPRVASLHDAPSPLFEDMASAVIHGKLIYRDGAPVDLVYLYVNPAFRRLTGLSPSPGQRRSELIPDAGTFYPTSLLVYDQVLRSGVTARYEDFSPSLGRWCSAQVSRVDEHHFVALISEITDRKIIELSLAQSQQLLREAQSIARIGCWQFDIENRTFSCSEGMAQLYELGDDDIHDRYAYTNRVHPDDRARVSAAFDVAARTMSPLGVRHRVSGKDGRVRHFQVIGRIDRRVDGKLGLIGTTQDVTDIVRSEMRLTATIEGSPVPLALNDNHGRITYLNAAFGRSFGYDLADIPTLDHWWPLAYPDLHYRLQVQEEWRLRLAEAHESGAPFRAMEVSIRAKDGSDRTAIATAAFVESEGDGIQLVKLFDITERKRLEQQLHRQSADLQSVIEASPTAMVMFDSDRRLISVNRQFYETHMIGDDQQLVPGVTTLDDLIRFFHRRGDYPLMSEATAVARFVGYVERRERVHLERETVHGRVLEVDEIPLDSGGTLLSYKDVTDHARKLDVARQAAERDPLTLLPNRRALESRYAAMMAERSAAATGAALLLIDLDRFKALNDSLGHRYGDLLLIEVAARLRRCVRDTDLVVRLGGDEFVVLLDGLPAGHAPALVATDRVAEDIRAALSSPYHLRLDNDEGGASSDCVYECSASIGGWILPDDAGPLANALQIADEALYSSKNQGRNAIAIYSRSA